MLRYKEKEKLPIELRLLNRDFKIGRLSWIIWVDEAEDGEEVRDLKHKKSWWPPISRKQGPQFYNHKETANNLNEPESGLSLRASRSEPRLAD